LDYFLNSGITLNHVLDVGCGNGQMLKKLCKNFNSKGIGVEPSELSINLLRNYFQSHPLITFEKASVHTLPFESDQFDLVLVNSVLHWVGRNEYLQSLGELIRVTKKYLVVMDFVASQDYKVLYHHRPGFFTYKSDFEKLILMSGVMKKVDEKRFWYDSSEDTVKAISESDLTPFLKNNLNYHSRKQIIFEKDYNILPTLSELDFIEEV
jgi:ubiquinone/menaquinone biosynthesis C-methylase UbiE